MAGFFTEFNGEPRNGLAKIYGIGEFALDWRWAGSASLEILWPGDRDDLLLESAAGISGHDWTQVTDPTNKLFEMNSTTIDPMPPMRIFRLRAR